MYGRNRRNIERGSLVSPRLKGSREYGTTGTVQYIVRSAANERAAMVYWRSGGESLELTSDLRKVNR